MMTTGSKIFFGFSLVGLFAAILYGVITNGVDQGGIAHLLSGNGAIDAIVGPLTLGYKGGVGDHLGYAVLLGFSVNMAGLGVASLAFRDADAEALAQLDGSTEASPVLAPTTLNAWPLVSALGLAAIIIGLASSDILLVVGVAIIVIAMIEWTISNWADSISADQDANRGYRNRLMLPVEVPVGGVLLVGVIVFSISRAFLASSEHGAILVAGVLAAMIFLVALMLNSRPQFKRSIVVGALAIGAVLILGIGIAGAVAGPRHFEKQQGNEGAIGAVHTAGSVSSGETD